MMRLNIDSYMPDTLPFSYSSDALADNTYNGQQTTPPLAAERSSWGTTRPRVGPCRVSKPSSAGNSPGSFKASRGRTLANDAHSTRRRHEQAARYISASLGFGLEETQPSRPMSWHPSTQTHFPAPPTHFHQTDLYSPSSQYSPEMASTFSSNTSPTVSFNSLPVPYGCVDGMTQMATDGWHVADRSSFCPSLNEPMYMGESYGAFDGMVEAPNSMDWNSFIMHGYNNLTCPSTPDSFLPSHPTTILMPHAAIPEAYCQTLDEAEDEGEILVGMGLYDDKTDEDPQLNHYRSAVTSLLGTTFRPQEPRGKGLKLEETWEPPKSDDDEGEEEEEEEEEAEEDDESEE